jgi:hypothetical protein
MPGPALALVTSDNTNGGTMLTWALPLALFVIVAVVLYRRFSRPHQRVPASRVALTGPAVPPPGPVATAAAVAGGLPTAAGGGGAESAAEPAGAARESAAAAAASNVSGRDDSAGQDDRPAPGDTGEEDHE